MNGSMRWSVAGLALGALTLVVAPAAAQRAAQPAQERSAREDAAGASARRLVHLRSGAVLRGVARARGDAWELQRGNEWLRLEADEVARVEKEADVLREAKRRERAATDCAARVELAGWLADEGLLVESLETLDAVLEERPHDLGALAALRARPLVAVPSLDVPAEERADALEALLRYAAGAPRAARELCIAELERCEDRAALRADVMAELGSVSLRRRAFAAQALGRLWPGEEAKRLLQHAVLDTSSLVRRSASEALGNADDPSLLAPVVRALASDNARVRVQAAEALGFMAYPAAVEPLVGYMASASQYTPRNRVPHGYVFFGRQRAYVQDFDVEVATFQAVADPQINVLLEGSVLEAGVIGVTQYGAGVETGAARSALRRITGEDPGHSVRAWESWWAEHREAWALRDSDGRTEAP
ncbi:MAG: HEAT repeat domain-containing protein [Planctomycetes bacterium]|nr:HEAT repeat domain-containing protein [Planctomycetota bacterium]